MVTVAIADMIFLVGTEEIGESVGVTLNLLFFLFGLGK